MVTSTSLSERNMELQVSNSQLVRNDICPPPKFKAYLEIAMKGDYLGALLSIPHRVIMIHDVRLCYM